MYKILVILWFGLKKELEAVKKELKTEKEKSDFFEDKVIKERESKAFFAI